MKRRHREVIKVDGSGSRLRSFLVALLLLDLMQCMFDHYSTSITRNNSRSLYTFHNIVFLKRSRVSVDPVEEFAARHGVEGFAIKLAFGEIVVTKCGDAML